MFNKFRTNHDFFKKSDDYKLEVEVREDEEQTVKLQEIIDLLVAAGYFRARIKGLHPFDKVVGGMTWCIESCNIDVDVDLLFQENSTIGQKIALTEKIVTVLPKMKCPHNIEPHQIQGLDFIHIFPVIQWLVKRSLEFRETISQFVRLYAVNQFNKNFGSSSAKSESNILKNVNTVTEIYSPRRYYKCTKAAPANVQEQVQITLLEYGNFSGNLETSVEKHTEVVTENEDLNKEDVEKLAEHYTSLQLEFKKDGTEALKEKQLSTLEDQLSALKVMCTRLNTKKSTLEDKIQQTTGEIEEIKSKQTKVNKKLEELKEKETEKPENVGEIEELILLNEDLKTQESQFKDDCKKELARLQEMIEEAKKRKQTEKTTEVNNNEEITENIKTLRLQLGKKNRTVAALQRQIDEVPKRPELAQYQRRFLELYNQVSSKHKETKQYYTLYNTMEDTKFYMKKELTLLNSISDSYPEAVLSTYAKDEFLNQFQNILEGVKQSKEKVEKQLADEKRKRDGLGSVLQLLIEQQRKYVAAVRELSIECRRHETLLAQYKS